MSGIYIEGMERPIAMSIEMVIHSEGTVEYRYKHGWETIKNGAVFVPDHGRTIDADALASRFDNGKQIISSYPFPKEFKAIYSQLADEMKDALRKCPTIIPADVTKDNNVPDKEEA